MAISAVVVAGICVLPLLVILATATESGLGVAAQQVFRPRVGELLGNTVSLVLVTTTACVVVGVGAAWLVERTELPQPGGGAWRSSHRSPCRPSSTPMRGCRCDLR